MILIPCIFAALFAVLSIVLLTGHGSGLIAGYNTATPEEKEKYDAKKLCRVAGAGISVFTIMFLIAALWGDVIPSFSTISIIVIVADVAAMLILMNTICKKKP